MSGLFHRFSLLISVLMLLSACAQPTLQIPAATKEDVERERKEQYNLLFDDLVSSKEYKQEKRLLNITYPLLAAGAEMCPDHVRNHFGFILYDPAQFDADAQWKRDAYIMEKGLRMLFVAEGFPAYKSGIRMGDMILEIDGEVLAGKPSSYALELLEKASRSGQSLTLWLKRDEKEWFAEVPPEQMCYYPPIIKRNLTLNAYADGKNVFVTSTMMDFAKKDEELALVMGHEIAHNILTHSNKKMGNILLGALADAVFTGVTGYSSNSFTQLGGLVYSKNFELEADYLGIYLMERAGYATSNVEAFWRRMAMENPQSIGGRFASTHPSSPERFVTISSTRTEIADKRRGGEPLIPNTRE